MNENKYKIVIINKENVLNEIININGDDEIFAIYLEDCGNVEDLYFQNIYTIKNMITNGDCLFIKKIVV